MEESKRHDFQFRMSVPLHYHHNLWTKSTRLESGATKELGSDSCNGPPMPSALKWLISRAFQSLRAQMLHGSDEREESGLETLDALCITIEDTHPCFT